MTATKRALPGPELVPFRGGSLLEWTNLKAPEVRPNSYEVDEWRTNAPFYATLQLTGIERGRSAARFMWYDAMGPSRYPMFMVDTAQLIMSGLGGVGGVVTTWWIVVKRGKNYGVAALDEQYWPALEEQKVAHA